MPSVRAFRIVFGFFFLWCLAFVFPVSLSLSPSCCLCRIQKHLWNWEETRSFTEEIEAPPDNIASTLVVFTDWRLFVVVGRHRSQRLFRRPCDWYHMKEVFVWATEYRHYSEGYSGKWSHSFGMWKHAAAGKQGLWGCYISPLTGSFRMQTTQHWNKRQDLIRRNDESYEHQTSCTNMSKNVFPFKGLYPAL